MAKITRKPRADRNQANRPTADEKREDEILQEARERFNRCEEWESQSLQRYREDERFYFADSDNGYQWPSDVRKNRDTDRRPMLTINKTRQYCLNITNDARQNKPAVKCRPAGNKATFQGAQVMEGIIRHIEYQSEAQAAYDAASATQVRGGIGYWRVTTDYANDKTFDQEIYIVPVPNPLTVRMDPDAQDLDGEDARYAFIFNDVSRDKFDTENPGLKDKVGVYSDNAVGPADWAGKDKVRVCEYYRVHEDEDLLIMALDQGQPKYFYKSELDKAIWEPLLREPGVRTRPVTRKQVQWFKICGDIIAEEKIWIGKCIPLVRIVGEQSVIDGQLDRKGHVRYLKDPQRIYNYWSSSAVEHVALQGKTPWVAPARAIEGQETYWRSANTENYSVLVYRDIDDQGKPIPKPERAQPPTMAPAYIQGLAIAEQEMRMVSGQYQEDLGQQSNATSGKAIAARQRVGDNATYHFIDNLAMGIRLTGRILVDIIPKIYDTARVVRMMGEDGQPKEVSIDPAAQQEYQEEQNQAQEQAKIIFNPGFGEYSVVADVGPAYATRRQEAFNAFTQIMAQQPELLKIAGDLMFRAADFPMADELAERLRRMVPEEALGKGLSPQVRALMEQNKQLGLYIQQLISEYGEERAKRSGLAADKTIDAFNAQTDRMKVLLDQFDPQTIATFTAQLVLQSMGMPPIPPKAAAAGAEGSTLPTGPGAPPPAPLGAPAAPGI